MSYKSNHINEIFWLLLLFLKCYETVLYEFYINPELIINGNGSVAFPYNNLTYALYDINNAQENSNDQYILYVSNETSEITKEILIAKNIQIM